MDSKGNWEKTIEFLKHLIKPESYNVYQLAGVMGVEALSNATPRLTGQAASSWLYKIDKQPNSITIEWHNTDIEGGYNVALLLQYGHGTGRGTYIQGLDYINPAMEPVFDKIAEMVWKETTE